MQSHHPIIAEATSSADDVTMIHLDDSTDVSNNFIADDDDEVASHVELSSDGMPTNQQWYHHEQEHDYLKNTTEMEPESSGMDDIDAFDEIIDNTGDIELIENDNAQGFNVEPVTRISNYDTELPQEILHKSEQQPSALLVNNFVQHADPVVVVEQPAQFNQVVMSQEDARESPQYNDFMMEESEIEMGAGTSCGNEIHNNFHSEN
jgi:hypothetical protein